MLRIRGAAFLLLTVAACYASIPRQVVLPHTFGPFPRCYDLTFGPWTIGNEPLDLYSPLPTRIALTAEPDRTFPDDTVAFRLARWPKDSLLRYGVWRLMGSDSIAIQLPSWWSTGLYMELRLTGALSHGRMDVYTDYSPMSPTFSPVELRAVPCPAPIPAPWRDDV